MIRQNEYCRVSARKCTRRTGEAVGNAPMVVNVQMYAKRKHAQFVVDRAAAARAQTVVGCHGYCSAGIYRLLSFAP